MLRPRVSSNGKATHGNGGGGLAWCTIHHAPGTMHHGVWCIMVNFTLGYSPHPPPHPPPHLTTDTPHQRPLPGEGWFHPCSHRTVVQGGPYCILLKCTKLHQGMLVMTGLLCYAMLCSHCYHTRRRPQGLFRHKHLDLPWPPAPKTASHRHKGCTYREKGVALVRGLGIAKYWE